MMTDSRDIGRPCATGSASAPKHSNSKHWKSQWHTWLLGVVLVVVTAAVFHRVVGFEFLSWDDDQHIVDNEYYAPVSFKNLLHFWGYSYIYMYIPVSYTFWGLEAWLSQFWPSANPADKFNPALFHLTNLLIHAGNVLLAYRLMWRFVRNAPAAFLGALLFAVHPLQVESVAWIGETRGLLAAFFSLLAVGRYCDFAGVDPEQGIFAERRYDPPHRRKRDFVWATLYFALALLSKPSAASLPAIVAAVDVLLLRRRWQDTLRWTALWFVMAAGITGLTKSYQKTSMIYGRSVRDLSDRPFVAGDAYAFYLRKLAWPDRLAFDYARTPFEAMSTPTYYYAWALPVGIAALLALSPRRRIWLGCYAIFILAILPVSGVVPFLYQSISTVADRYMYVPLVGFGLLLAAWTATRRNPALIAAVAGLLLGLAAHRTFEQTEHWRDDWHVFRQGLAVTPTSYTSHLHLGNRLRREKQSELAIEHYRRMLELRDDYFTTHHLIGLCYIDLGRYDDAIRECEQTVAINHTYSEAWRDWGLALVGKGDLEGALVKFRRAVEADAKKPEPYRLAGETLEKLGRVGEAETEFKQALTLDEGVFETHLRYGRMLAKADHFSDAVVQFEQAATLKPDDLAPHYELATTYFRQGKFAPAIDEAERAVALKPNDFGSLQTLGLARAAAGRTAAAIEPLEKALQLVSPASAQAASVRKTLEELKSK